MLKRLNENDGGYEKLQQEDKKNAAMGSRMSVNIEDISRLDELMTIEELQNDFSLSEITSMVRENVLQDWLRERFLNAEADALSEKNIESLNNNSLSILICNTLGIDIMTLCEHEANLLIAAVNRERKGLLYEQLHGNNEISVSNQAELVKSFQNSAIKKVYLYDNVFSIPLERTDITYVGKGNAVVSITVRDDDIIDFDDNHVYFYNLTIVFHYLEPGQVKIDHSSSSKHNNHIIFLRENRITQDAAVKPNDMANFLVGRKPFESAHDFTEEAKKFQGVIVGKTFLNAADYDLWHNVFFMSPKWRVEFIECLRRYVCGAKIVFQISCEEAKNLFERGRVQLIYADFSTDRDNAVIVRLYLHAEDGQGKIYEIHRLWCATSWSFGSGSGDAGYGLDLIDYDLDNRHKSNIVSYD